MSAHLPPVAPDVVFDYVKGRRGRICDLPPDLLDRLAPITDRLFGMEAAAIRGVDAQSVACGERCRQAHWCLVNGCARTELQPQAERV